VAVARSGESVEEEADETDLTDDTGIQDDAPEGVVEAAASEPTVTDSVESTGDATGEDA